MAGIGICVASEHLPRLSPELTYYIHTYLHTDACVPAERPPSALPGDHVATPAMCNLSSPGLQYFNPGVFIFALDRHPTEASQASRYTRY